MATAGILIFHHNRDGHDIEAILYRVVTVTLSNSATCGIAIASLRRRTQKNELGDRMGHGYDFPRLAYHESFTEMT